MKIVDYDYQRDLAISNIILELCEDDPYYTVVRGYSNNEYKSDGFLVYSNGTPVNQILVFPRFNELLQKNMVPNKLVKLVQTDLLSEESYFQHSTLYDAFELHVMFIFQYLMKYSTHSVSMPMRSIWNEYEK